MQGNSHNVDRHLLATLHEANFEEVGETLNRNWFQKHVQHVVVDIKRRREEELDPVSLPLRKRRHTDKPSL